MAEGWRAGLIAILVAASLPCGWLGARIAATYWESPVRRGGLATIAAMSLAFAWAAATVPPTPILAASLALGFCLIVLAAIDVVAFRLPDILTLPLLAGGVLLSWVLPHAPVVDHLIGAVVGYGTLYVMNRVFERFLGREGIGLGDAKLFAASGAWLGWAPLPSVLLIACGAAFVWIGVRVLLRGRSVLNERIAFGAPLCLAIWIVWLYGPLAV